jgi:hypothetical protein
MLKSNVGPLSVLALYFAIIAACHPPVSLVTPEGQAAWKADQVLTRVEELQNVAIDANTQKSMSDADAINVVQWTRAATVTLKAYASGDWRGLLKPGYVQFKAHISQSAKDKLKTYLTVFDAILGVQ